MLALQKKRRGKGKKGPGAAQTNNAKEQEKRKERLVFKWSFGYFTAIIIFGLLLQVYILGNSRKLRDCRVQTMFQVLHSTRVRFKLSISQETIDDVKILD